MSVVTERRFLSDTAESDEFVQITAAQRRDKWRATMRTANDNVAQSQRLAAAFDLARQYAQSKKGWVPTSPEAVFGATSLLREIMTVETSVPAVTPTPEGGVVLEWHDGGWDIEIEADSGGRLWVWAAHVSNGTEFSGGYSETTENLRIALKDMPPPRSTQ